MLQESAVHNKGVQYLGLYGMGGLGKTTMCKVLHNHFWSKFSQRACIVDLGIASMKLDRQKHLMTKFTTLKKGAISNIKDSDVVSIHRPIHFLTYRQSRHITFVWQWYCYLLIRASPPILKNGWTELILWEAACKSAPPSMQNGWFVGRAGLEVEVGLQIGVILQVGAPAPKPKRSPLNNKGQTPYSSPISKVPMRFILLLFLPCFITMYTSHGWVTRLANQPTWTYCEDDPPCILWDGWWCSKYLTVIADGNIHF